MTMKMVIMTTKMLMLIMKKRMRKMRMILMMQTSSLILVSRVVAQGTRIKPGMAKILTKMMTVLMI
jgi:hypothetical protein